jgi:uncharacterized protein (DUF302 family)
MSDNAPTYGLQKRLDIPFEEADRRVRTALQAQGFGILTEIDVKETLKQKLDVEHRPYRILGACNPPLAHRALSADRSAGLLLPCNVIVYEGDRAGTSVVAVMDPVIQLEPAGNEVLEALGREVRERLERVLDALEGPASTVPSGIEPRIPPV